MRFEANYRLLSKDREECSLRLRHRKRLFGQAVESDKVYCPDDTVNLIG